MNDLVMQVTDNMISQMFCDYVGSMDDKERHTKEAQHEIDMFDSFCTGAFSSNVRLQNELYERMMNCAVEYEESGFIAGFRWALKLLNEQEQIFEKDTQISTQEEEKRKPEAVNVSQEDIMLVDTANKDCITTKQIAEMFETTNFKVVRRIEKQILPYLDAESKRYFDKVEGRNVQHKPITFYRLNKAACQLYLKEVEPKRKNFINIAGGYAKLQELMESVFPAEVRAVTV